MPGKTFTFNSDDFETTRYLGLAVLDSVKERISEAQRSILNIKDVCRKRPSQSLGHNKLIARFSSDFFQKWGRGVIFVLILFL